MVKCKIRNVPLNALKQFFGMMHLTAGVNVKPALDKHGL